MSNIEAMRKQTVQLFRLAELRYRRQLSRIATQKALVATHRKQRDTLAIQRVSLCDNLHQLRDQIRHRDSLTAHELQTLMHRDSDCQHAIELCSDELNEQEKIVLSALSELHVLQVRLHEVKVRIDALSDALGKRMVIASSQRERKLAEQLEDEFAQRGYSSC